MRGLGPSAVPTGDLGQDAQYPASASTLYTGDTRGKMCRGTWQKSWPEEAFNRRPREAMVGPAQGHLVKVWRNRGSSVPIAQGLLGLTSPSVAIKVAPLTSNLPPLPRSPLWRSRAFLKGASAPRGAEQPLLPPPGGGPGARPAAPHAGASSQPPPSQGQQERPSSGPH